MNLTQLVQTPPELQHTLTAAPAAEAETVCRREALMQCSSLGSQPERRDDALVVPDAESVGTRHPPPHWWLLYQRVHNFAQAD
jgi:poly(3-hydroxybutyrate) depolymerase